MKSTTMFEALSAAHLSFNMNGVPSEFDQRGGIMLVASPGHLKSTFIKQSLGNYPNALVLSDLNVRQLIVIRDDIAAQKYCTMGFPDYEKLYQRDAETASNLEGHIKGMTEEGFGHASFEDKRMKTQEARCLIVGAMTPAFYKRRFAQWKSDGFLRRFLWCHYHISNPGILPNAIHTWKPLKIGTGELPGLSQQPIEFDVTELESEVLHSFLQFHEGEAITPFVLLKKMLSVLKWRHRKLGPERASFEALETLRDFSEGFAQNGAKVDIENQEEKPNARKPETNVSRKTRPLQSVLGRVSKSGARGT